ncbi:BI1-like protein [Telopea speciosissima]|uniref:BI1-like protein n=1 Tax=Telopea speciosissima TaxID=54955 RepID=UPI001CC34550|nr:BI1-like protein [Telopea speciosissima]
MVFGSITKPLIDALLFPQKQSIMNVAELPSFEELHISLLEDGGPSDEGVQQTLPRRGSLSLLISQPTSTVHYFWRKFDDRYMRPMFGGRGFVPFVPSSPTGSHFSIGIYLLAHRDSEFDCAVVSCSLYIYHRKRSLKFLFLGLFTATIIINGGVICAFIAGKVLLEALILLSAVVPALTGYFFWVSKKGKAVADLSNLELFLFSSFIILFLTGFIQMFFPLGSTTAVAICGGIYAMIFSWYLLYDMEKLMKRFTYDEYIWASTQFYLDFLDIFPLTGLLS